MKVLLLALLGLAFARTLPDCPKGISKKKPSSSYCRCPAGSYIRAERQRVRSGRYRTASEKVGFYCKSNKRKRTKRAACPMTATKAKPSTTMCSCPKKVTNGKRYVLHATRMKTSGGPPQGGPPQGGRGGSMGGRGGSMGGRGGYSQGGRGGYSRGGRGGYQPQQRGGSSGRGRGLQQQQQRGGSRGGYNPYQRGGSSRGGSQQGYPSRGGYSRGGSSRGQRGQGRGGRRGGRGNTQRGGRGGRRGGRGGRRQRPGFGYYCAELKQCSASAASSKTAVSTACFCQKGARLHRVFKTVQCPQKQRSGRGGRGSSGRGNRNPYGGRGQGQQGGRGQGGYNPYGRGQGSQGRGQQGGRGGYSRGGMSRGGSQGGYQRGGRGQQRGGGNRRRMQYQRGGQQQRGGSQQGRPSRGGYQRGGSQGRGQQGGRGGYSRGGSQGGYSRGGSMGGRGGSRGGRRHQRTCRQSSYYCATVKACPSTATSAAKGTANYCKCAKGARLMRHITRGKRSSRYSRGSRSSRKAVYYCSTAKACPSGVSSQFSCICTKGKKAYKRLAGTSSSRARFGVYCRMPKGSSSGSKTHQKKSWCSRLHYVDECGRSRGCQWDRKTRRCSAGYSGDEKKYQKPATKKTTTGGGH